MNRTNSDQIEALNKVLNGEHMAINAYNTFLNKIDDPHLKELLSKYKRDHEEHAAILADRIKELGEQPEESNGAAQVMSQMMTSAQTMIISDQEDIIKKLYDGEDKGIAAAENIIRNDLNDENKELVSEIISTDHDHLKGLQSLWKM